MQHFYYYLFIRGTARLRPRHANAWNKLKEKCCDCFCSHSHPCVVCTATRYDHEQWTHDANGCLISVCNSHGKWYETAEIGWINYTAKWVSGGSVTIFCNHIQAERPTSESFLSLPKLVLAWMCGILRWPTIICIWCCGHWYHDASRLLLGGILETARITRLAWN